MGGEPKCSEVTQLSKICLDAEQTWSLFMTLLQAEQGFCALKATLGTRPNYHQLEGRVNGHPLISVLAYHLLTWMRDWKAAFPTQKTWVKGE